MTQSAQRTLTALMVAIAVSSLLSNPDHALSKGKEKIRAVRWAESNPGCTLSRGDDGKYRYGLWADDAAVVLAVDGQELEKVHRRHEPFFAVLVTVRYLGQTSVDV